MTGPSSVNNFLGNFPKLQNVKDEFTNLSQKSRIELVDLLHREEKLCKNKKFLDKLPDKGEKILKYYNQVKEEIEKRDNQENLCGELAKLTVDESKTALDRLEWTGNYKTDTKDLTVEEDETNPFKILATHSGTEASKHKIIKFESQSESEPPITKEEQNNDLPNIDVYAKQLCHRFDSNTGSTKKKFYTNKPLDRTLVKESVKNQDENTSSTISNEVKMLSLQESIAIQHHQNKTLKEIELHSAMERLRTKIDIKCRSPQTSVYDYRERLNSESDDEISSATTSEESEQDDE